MEQITLVDPEQGVPARPATMRYIPKRIVLELGTKVDPVTGVVTIDPDNSTMSGVLIGDWGYTVEKTWVGPTTHAEMVLLNKANLTVNTLWKRLLLKMLTELVVKTGNVTGAAD